MANRGSVSNRPSDLDTQPPSPKSPQLVTIDARPLTPQRAAEAEYLRDVAKKEADRSKALDKLQMPVSKCRLSLSNFFFFHCNL